MTTNNGDRIATPTAPQVVGEPVAWKSELKRAISEYADALEDERYAYASDVHANICRLIDSHAAPVTPRAAQAVAVEGGARGRQRCCAVALGLRGDHWRPSSVHDC